MWSVTIVVGESHLTYLCQWSDTSRLVSVSVPALTLLVVSR